MADLKISEMDDGGLIQTTDEVPVNRAGANYKILVGSAAGYDVGSDIGEVLLILDIGGQPGLPAIDGSQLINLPPPIGIPYSVNGISADSGGDITITADDISDGGTNKFVTSTEKSTWNAKLNNITGLITAGTGVTITGTGVGGDPYQISLGDKLASYATNTLTAANKIPYATALDTAAELDFSTNVALGSSDTTVPSQKAVKDYVDGKTLSGLTYMGTLYITSNTNFTKASYPGLKKIKVIGTGGGGGGGGSGSVNQSCGAGGGAGSTFIKEIDASNLSASETCTIGTAGAGGTTTGDGSSGGTTSFGAHATATGGVGGVAGTTGSEWTDGGAATGGDINFDGGQGCGGRTYAADSGMKGNGGNSFWGQGGIGLIVSGSGREGSAPGAGGGGGFRTTGGSQVGGAGASGICIVEIWG